MNTNQESQYQKRVNELEKTNHKLELIIDHLNNTFEETNKAIDLLIVAGHLNEVHLKAAFNLVRGIA
jgi:uncharacterized coiled-coil protein SlyX